MAASTTSYLLIVCGGCNKAFRVWKCSIKVGADNTEGHCIKAMVSLSMVEVLQARLRPDDCWYGVAASTTSYLSIVCGCCNIAFRVWKWAINVGADSTERHCINTMVSLSMVEVLQARLSPDWMIVILLYAGSSEMVLLNNDQLVLCTRVGILPLLFICSKYWNITKQQT